MGSLKQIGDRIGLVLRVFSILDEAGWTQKDLEHLSVDAARQMRNLISHPLSEDDRKKWEARVRLANSMPKGMSDEAQLARWVWLYEYRFGIILDPSTIKLPPRPAGMARLIVVVTDDLQVINAATRPVSPLDFDRIETPVSSVRTCKDGPYAVWVGDYQEANRENQRKPAADFDQKNAITLQERLLYGLMYLHEQNLHLDGCAFTICGGSRYSDGTVPTVGQYGRDTVVSSISVDERNTDLQAVRCAVAL